MPDRPLFRPRRSLLYTPGTRTDRIEKAMTAEVGADCVVADLEDAVGPDDKASARKAVTDLVAGLSDTRAERCIRINGIATPWHKEDLAAVVPAQPDAIVVPKVESIPALTDLELDLEELEEEHGLDAGTIPLIVQLETAPGIANALELARTIADPVAPLTRVAALVFGAEDFAANVGARRTAAGHEVLLARSQVVLAASIAKVQAIDQVFIDYKDAEGLAKDARYGRDLGFDGKQVIHPDQLDPVHEAFTPSEEEVARARELMAVVEDAGIGEGGVIGFQGRMIDRPVIEQARQVVALANGLGL